METDSNITMASKNPNALAFCISPTARSSYTPIGKEYSGKSHGIAILFAAATMEAAANKNGEEPVSVFHAGRPNYGAARKEIPDQEYTPEPFVNERPPHPFVKMHISIQQREAQHGDQTNQPQNGPGQPRAKCVRKCPLSTNYCYQK
jgi:hypothetical protein